MGRVNEDINPLPVVGLTSTPAGADTEIASVKLAAVSVYDCSADGVPCGVEKPDNVVGEADNAGALGALT